MAVCSVTDSLHLIANTSYLTPHTSHLLPTTPQKHPDILFQLVLILH